MQKDDDPSFSLGFGGGSTSHTIDEVSSADVAATIARGANLLMADNVQNLADSLNAEVEFATSNEAFVSKPQIVATDARTKDDIRTYVVKKNETIGSIAKKFNITSDTIRWENGLTGDLVAEGTKLTILPVNGLRITVKSSDSAKSLANKYKSSEAQIIAFNDLEISGLKSGQKIIIPDGVKPEAPRPTYYSTYLASSTPVTTGYSGFAFGTEPLYGGNGYSYGYCTWHAANRRAQIGRPIPRNLGNASTWKYVALNAGLSVTGTPRAGDVLWHKATYIAGGFGHVGFVEKVNKDGSILVSDMNYPIWNGITTRTVPVDELSLYEFIH